MCDKGLMGEGMQGEIKPDGLGTLCCFREVWWAPLHLGRAAAEGENRGGWDSASRRSASSPHLLRRVCPTAR